MCAVRNLAFPVEEYKKRLDQVQAAMAAHGLDALLVRNRADLCYLTGMETCYMVAYHAAIVPLKGEPILLASDFEMLNALVGAWCEDRVTFAVTADPIVSPEGAEVTGGRPVSISYRTTPNAQMSARRSTA